MITKQCFNQNLKVIKLNILIHFNITIIVVIIIIKNNIISLHEDGTTIETRGYLRV
jgi:hypothetical protein